MKTALGHAFIIASILGATVDAYAKGKLIREASRDIAEYIAGFPLPEELRPKIVEILSNRVIARNAHLHYTITPVDDGRVRLDVTWTYELENISPLLDTYPCTMYHEEYTQPVMHRIWLLTNVEGAGYDIANPVLEEMGDGVLRVVPRGVVIQPHQAGRFYKFGFQYSYLYPDNYIEYFFFGRATIGAEITVVCPPEFQVVATPTDTHTANNWIYNKAFLKGEQLIIRWRRRNAAPMSQPADNPAPASHDVTPIPTSGAG